MMIIITIMIVIDIEMKIMAMEVSEKGFLMAPNHRRRLTTGCIILIIHKRYSNDYEHDEPIECELQEEDLMQESYRTLRVQNFTTSWAMKNQIISGITTLFSKEAEIDLKSNELLISLDQPWQVRDGRHMNVGNYVLHS
jgi:hypothetical protein